MGKFSRLGNELYQGRKTIDFVHRKSLWYSVSLLLVAAALSVIFVRGMNFGVEFTGGINYRVDLPANQVTQAKADELRQVIADSGIEAAGNPQVTTSVGKAILVQTEDLDQADSDAVTKIIVDTLGVTDPQTQISQDEIGASWGREVAERAGIGVLVFLVLVVLFIWAYFREWKMSVAALIALFHDIIITVGIYALSGFQVTPSAVTGLLAILGFSLYDTVVVFDKVRENTADLSKSRLTYANAANLAVNQTLVRSVNTAIVALIPIGAILYVSAVQLGASSLQDLALAQFVGMAVGVYSSIFLAPRLLVHMKSSETDVVLAEKRAKARERAAADRYATVPAFVDDMPEHDEPGEDDEDGEPRAARSVAAPPRAPEATGKGRVVPPARGPVRESGAAGRQQPSRETRSKRGKK